MTGENKVTLEMVYAKLEDITQELEEINDDLHVVRPEFVEKLRGIEKGKFHTFNNVADMEKFMDK